MGLGSVRREAGFRVGAFPAHTPSTGLTAGKWQSGVDGAGGQTSGRGARSLPSSLLTCFCSSPHVSLLLLCHPDFDPVSVLSFFNFSLLAGLTLYCPHLVSLHTFNLSQLEYCCMRNQAFSFRWLAHFLSYNMLISS